MKMWSYQSSKIPARFSVWFVSASLQSGRPSSAFPKTSAIFLLIRFHSATFDPSALGIRDGQRLCKRLRLVLLPRPGVKVSLLVLREYIVAFRLADRSESFCHKLRGRVAPPPP